MKIYQYEGKNYEELLEKALKELKVSEDEVIIKQPETEGGLFKSKKLKLELLLKSEVIEYAKEFITNITNQMGIQVNIEVQKRNKNIKLNLFSDKNNILIGKMGKTIDSLQTLLKYSILNQTGFYINIILDVENYKENQHRSLEYVAIKIAKEVESTGVEAKLDNMNSYERRLIHESLSKITSIYTESIGEEPNRHIVIKPRKE